MTEPRDWTSGAAEILVRKCCRCAHRFYLPRARCPRCFADCIDAQPAVRTGVVAAVTVLPALRQGGDERGICLVDLDDGIRVMTRCSPDVKPGDRITTGFPPRGADDQAPLVPISWKAP